MFINNSLNNSQCVLVFSDAQHTQAVEEKSVFVRVGDAVTLPCLFNRSLWEEGARMGWSRYRRNAHKIFQLHKDFPNKKSTLSASNNNMNITGLGVKEGDFPLFISPVRFDDYGRFTCFYRKFSNPKQTILVVELITAEVLLHWYAWTLILHLILYL
uniref:Ig-like domain-containing protein n=1 Tax=Eptatretus burgeri TaxID=7764 RepID=A0A8C4QIN1_EPTBU